MNKKIVFATLYFLSTVALASSLNFTVTNLSKSRMYFMSTDLLDAGTDIYFNQTRSHTYNHPPKNMRIGITNGASSFYIMTDPSCDELGFDPAREMTLVKSGWFHTKITRYPASKVNITISEMEGSTIDEMKIKCSITRQS